MESHVDEDPDRAFDFPPATSPFRGALEYGDPEQRQRERSLAERKHKKRESYFDTPWNPMKWITESPRDSPGEELPQFDFGQGPRTDGGHEGADADGEAPAAGPSAW